MCFRLIRGLPREDSMRLQLEEDIKWDGRTLSAWINAQGQRVQLLVDREVIHCIPFYNDAISREIERDALDIMNHLKPYIVCKLAAGSNISATHGPAVRLVPEDITTRPPQKR
jgi:hypothetical protein